MRVGRASAPHEDRWTCMSQSPGIRYLPVPSITRALRGTSVVPEGPIAAMRVPSTITVILRIASEGTLRTLAQAVANTSRTKERRERILIGALLPVPSYNVLDAT